VAHIYGGDERTSGLNVELQTDTDQPQRAILVSSVVEWDDTERVQTSVFPITGTPSDSDRLLYNQATDQAPSVSRFRTHPNPDNPLIHVNGGFCEQTGYDRKEILGRNCRFLQGEATREEPVARMREAITAEEPVTVELRNYRKDGSMFWNRVWLFRSGMTQEQPRTTSAINRTSPTRSDTNRISRCSKYRLSSPKKQS